ncbi:M3 family metallopeptidase [Pseudomonas sp. NPDC089534]|uniref:M3 family metallopeptidase n=1 Tax=Pseudomonas sp. NPDC089534 TaxID=3364468 RepID=UPI00381552C5
MPNPLLQQWTLPPWNEVRAEHLLPAIQSIIADNRRIIAEVIAGQAAHPNWDDLVIAVDQADARLEEAENVIDTLSTIHSGNLDWDRESALCEAAIGQYLLDRRSDQALFRCFVRLASSSVAGSFSPSRKASLAKILRRYRLSGIELPTAQRQRLGQLNGEIQRLEKTFSDNLELAGAAWSKRIDDDALLAGLPRSMTERLASDARDAGHGGWLLKLDLNSFEHIMRHAQNRSLRAEYFQAYCTRASDQGPQAHRFDNGPALQALLALRHEKARLLGYDNFAQLRLETHAATGIAQVRDFLRSQLTGIHPSMEKDMQSLKALALELGIAEVEAWDHEFLCERRRRQQAPELADLKDFLALEETLHRLLRFSEHMFSIGIREKTDVPNWHAQVRLFEISEHGQVLGYLYMDFFHRDGAPDYAWTQTLRNRSVNAEGRTALPVAVLRCNFTPVGEGVPCLLSHQDLRVLFHEFGHGLQQVLTRAVHHNQSGISQLPRDTAEFAGQLFEHWCRSPAFMAWLAVHHQTGERLTEARLATTLAALEAYTSRSQAIQLMGALLDLELHRGQGDGRRVDQVFEAVLDEIPALKLPAYCRFANGFDYLVTGYEAAVYAYDWSRVLANDAFKRFETEGVFNPRTGLALRQAFFTWGDGQSLGDAMERFLDHKSDEDR